MRIVIEKSQISDAEQIIEYLKTVGGESDNLSFGKEGIRCSIEDEEKYIDSMLKAENSIHLLAKIDGEIVGDISLSGNARERVKHRGEIGISVKKKYWGMGIGSRLLADVISFAKNDTSIEILSLMVRSDNVRAIRLYEKFGFNKTGCFKGYIKIDEEYFDCDIMNLYL